MHSFANNVWIEITRREDIGADVKAPSAARSGGVTGSYVLVPVVRPDDVVIHYDSRREAIVGASVRQALRSQRRSIGWPGEATPAARGPNHAGCQGCESRWIGSRS
jgi:hypothetical protein